MKHYDIIEYFKTLNSEEQKSVIDNLMSHLTSKEFSIGSTRQAEMAKTGLFCPNCNNKNIVGYGKYKDTVRYRCKDCRKTFIPVTGSVVHWMHKKELLKQYLYFMLQGLALREISDKMDICLKTAFDWRHKILNGLTTDENVMLSGVVEADETFFLYSEKGSKNIKNRKIRKRGGLASKKGINKDHVTVLTAYERKSGNCINTVVCRGRITKKAIEKGLGRWLDSKQSILCSDSHLSFDGYAKDNNIVLKRTFVRRKEFVVDKIYHIQHVNSIHSNLKKWIIRFNGVSTKYLQNYLNYYNLIRRIGNRIDMAEKALLHLLRKNDVFIPRDKINQQICIT